MKPQLHKRLETMTKEAAEHASMAMSKLTGEKVTVKIAKAEIKNVQKEFLDVHPESMVAGIYLPITGDIHGSSLLIFPEEMAHELCNLLFRRDSAGKMALSELDQSALKEVGNIICGSFLTVISNTLKIKIIEHVPSFSFDMFGAIVDNVVTKFVDKAEKGLVIEVKFDFIKADVEGYVVLIFGLDEMEIILKAMEAEE